MKEFIVKIARRIIKRNKTHTQELSKKSLGSQGEALAEQYLIKLGYKILKKNFRCSLGEIDIIAKEKDCIVFIEVKTRTNADTIYPEDSINNAKQIRLQKIAYYYIQYFAEEENEFRFDVVSITMNNTVPEIYLIQDAF